LKINIFLIGKCAIDKDVRSAFIHLKQARDKEVVDEASSGDG